MYIVIVGGGKVGYYLAKQLLQDGHEILVIEKDPRKADHISTEMGEIVLRGDGTEVWLMQEAGLPRADLVVAVTGDDEDNLMICQMAKKKFGVKRAIARINNPKNQRIFRLLGINDTVSATDMILAQIEREIPAHSLIHLMTLREAGAAFLETTVPLGSPAIGKTIEQLNLPDECVLALIIRNQKGIVPHGKTVIQSGDEIVGVTTSEHENIFDSVFASKAQVKRGGEA
jgi:trk system potassium uptake protein TrkA